MGKKDMQELHLWMCEISWQFVPNLLSIRFSTLARNFQRL
jgi:hypothetical protein